VVKALLFGTLAGAAVAGGLLWLKKGQLEVRARQLQADIDNPVSRAALAVQARAMKARLEAYANTRADAVAHQAGDAHMAAAYGITPERVRGLQVLIQRFTPPRL
jgi:outer membrane murein-binding lipoprotein Lpp